LVELWLLKKLFKKNLILAFFYFTFWLYTVNNNKKKAGVYMWTGNHPQEDLAKFEIFD